MKYKVISNVLISIPKLIKGKIFREDRHIVKLAFSKCPEFHDSILLIMLNKLLQSLNSNEHYLEATIKKLILKLQQKGLEAEVYTAYGLKFNASKVLLENEGLLSQIIEEMKTIVINSNRQKS